MGDRAHAQALYNQGVDSAHAAGGTVALLSHAFQCFVSAAYADPSWWQGHYQCGNNASDLNQMPGVPDPRMFSRAALACYRRALECNDIPAPDAAKLWSNYGWQHQLLGQNEEAVIASRRAVELDPTLYHPHVNMSCAYGILDRPEDSIREAEIAFALENNPITEMSLAFACLFGRQFARGFKHFERRFEYKLKQYLHYPYPRWAGEEGRTVFLQADQGLGDTLSFARFLPAACRCASYVHAAIQPELMRVFQHAFVGLPNLNLIPLPVHFPPADFWTTFVSLPFALGLTDAEIRAAPGIDMPVFGLPRSWIVPDRKLHIGIAWAGSQLNDINAHRSIPLGQFLDLYRVPGVQLYSLQADERAKDIGEQGLNPVVRDLKPYIRDVADTVSLMQHLDLVVTIESALGHIAAAAGKECWIPYSHQGRDYRLGNFGDDMIWTPRHRIFRQERGEQWDVVFDRIVEALRCRIS